MLWAVLCYTFAVTLKRNSLTSIGLTLALCAVWACWWSASRCGRLGALLSLRGDIQHGGEAVRLAEGLLAFVGYSGALERSVGGLAHVDKRVVEIARALAIQPRVLCLDEPAAGLGPRDTERLGKLLRQVADAGVAVVLVEHYMHLIMGLSDHVVVLDAGRVIAAGSPAQVRRDEAVRKAYLGERAHIESAWPVAGRDHRRPPITSPEQGSSWYQKVVRCFLS